MPQGATIGRVNVKVLPDTDDFRRAAQRDLNRIEDQLKITVKIQIDTAMLRGQLDHIKDQLQRWKRENDPLKINVDVAMVPGQTVGIAARLAYLTRPRTVSIMPVMNQGATANIATALAALSGARVLSDTLENLWNIGKEFDRLVPKIGAAGLAIGGLGSLALTSISNITALTLSLSQMMTAGLAAPGMFAGAAVGAGVFITALTQMKQQAPEVIDQFKGLADLIGKNFWDEATAGVLALTKVYLPQLGLVATELGTFFGQLTQELSGPFQAALPGMFANLNESIAIATGGTKVFAGIITSLGLAGAEYLPRFSQWIVDIATKWDAWLANASATGELQAFIESGIQGFKDLGSILVNAAKVIGDISKAAQAGGGSVLSTMADTLERIRAVTSSTEFQTTLISVFKTAHEVMSGIATQVGPVLEVLFKNLADTFVKIGPTLTQGLGTALAAIAGALANPALQSGIQVVFQALAEAINALAPAMMPLSDGIAALAPLFAALLGAIAPLITAALIPLSQIVQTLAPALTPLVNLLGSALLKVIQALGPALVQVAQVLVSVVAAAMPLVETILNLLVPAITWLVSVVQTAMTGAMEGVRTAFDGIRKIFDGFATMFSGGWDNFWKGILQVLSGLWQLIVGFLKLGFSNIVAIFKGVLPVLKGLWNSAWNWIKTMASSIWNGIKSGFSSFMSTLVNIPGRYFAMLKTFWSTAWDALKTLASRAFDKMKTTISEKIGDVVAKVKELPGKAKNALGDLSTKLLSAGKDLIQGFIDGIGSMVQKVKDKLGELTGKLTDWKGPAEYDKVVLFGAGVYVIDGFINGLESRYDAVRKSLRGLSSDIAGYEFSAPGLAAATGNLGNLADGSASSAPTKVFNYYAAPGSSLGSEEDLFAAAARPRMVGW